MIPDGGGIFNHSVSITCVTNQLFPPLILVVIVPLIFSLYVLLKASSQTPFRRGGIFFYKPSKPYASSCFILFHILPSFLLFPNRSDIGSSHVLSFNRLLSMSCKYRQASYLILLRNFVQNSDTHFRVMCNAYHVRRPYHFVHCCQCRSTAVSRYGQTYIPLKPRFCRERERVGFALFCFIYIHYTCFWIVPECRIVLNGSIFIPCIQSTTYTPLTDVMRLDPTEKQRSPQSQSLHHKYCLYLL